MLLTESKLRQIIAEEFESLKKEAFRGSRFGGSKPRRSNEFEEARSALEDAIDSAFSKYYEQKKAELAGQGKNIKPEQQLRDMVEKEKQTWLSSYKAGMGSGSEDDRGLSSADRIMQMPPRLHKIAVLGDAMIPNWDVRNNMYDGYEG